MADAENSMDIEKLQAQIEELRKDNEFLRSEAKKAFEKRDSLKREIEEREAKALEEQQKYKELYEATKPKLNQFEEELKRIQSEKEEALRKYKEVEESTKEQLLSQLPEGKSKEFAKKINNLMDLREFVEIAKKDSVATDKSLSAKPLNGKPEFKSFAEWQKYVNKL